MQTRNPNKGLWAWENWAASLVGFYWCWTPESPCPRDERSLSSRSDSKDLVLRGITGDSHSLWLQREGRLMPVPFWRHDHQGLEKDTIWKAISYDALSESFDLGQTEATESKMKHSKHICQWTRCYRVSCLGQCTGFLVNEKKDTKE